MATTFNVAIIICTHNRSSLLLKTLNSVFNNREIPKGVFSLHLVLNACTDDTYSKIQSLNHHDIPIEILEEQRPGKSYALNHALNKVDRDYYFFLDDDQLLEPDYLFEMYRTLTNKQAINMLTGYMMPAWDGSEPKWVHNTPPYAIPIRPFPEYDLGGEARILGENDKLPSGGNIIVRKRVIDTVGGFSTELGPTGHNLQGGEDHDFVTRALKSGFVIFYNPQLRQFHQIEPERLSTRYMLRKSYKRSYSHVLMKNNIKPRFYMISKIIKYILKSSFSLNGSIRFFYLIRLAASLGEMTAAIKGNR